MLIWLKSILLVITLLLITSCKSPEHQEALRLYDVAKASKNIQQLTLALRTLVQLAPEKYQTELAKVEQAYKQLAQAKHYQAQDDHYSAYLSSHDSYRSIPSVESKKILVSSGKTLIPILEAKLSIDHSLETLTKNLQQRIEKFHNLPIKNWNLIEANTSIEKLTIAINELTTAHTLVMKVNSQKNHIPNLTTWQNAISNQQLLLTRLRSHFADLAQFYSAKLLQRLNRDLTTESIKLLALLRSQFAQESMQKMFIKSREEYTVFQKVIENIALAENLKSKDKHAHWYLEWHDLETKILAPQGNFKDYPINSKSRNNRLLSYLDSNKTQLPLLAEPFSKKILFNQSFSQIIELTTKLMTDKSLVR